MRQSDKNSVNGFLLGRAVVAGLLVTVLVLALLLPVSWQQRLRNEADLAAATRVQSVETAVRLQQEIDHYLRLLELLRDTLVDADGNLGDAFAVRAASMAATWPTFQAINWLSPDGEVRQVVPLDGNRVALEMNVQQVPLAAPAFRRALASDGIAATPPLELRQGGRGLTTYLAVRRDGELLGVINGVFRLDRLFETLTAGGLLARYAIRVTDGNALVYANGAIPEQMNDAPQPSVIFDQRSWRLLLAPRAERVADFGAQFRDEAVAILAAALLAGLLTGLFTFKRLSLRQTERRFRELNRLLPDMVLECDEFWRVTYLNRLAQEQLGYDDGDLLDGLQLDRLLELETLDANLATLRDQLDDEYPLTRMCTVRCADGGTTSCETTLGAIRDDGGQFRGLRVVMRDITERIEAEHAMNRLANFDSTTELPNRSMFLQVLDHELRQAQIDRRRLVLMVIDLDNFKSINDRLGPSMGDMLLREAGQRLRDALEGREYVFRVSGDEFAVLFNSLDAAPDIERMAQLLLNTLRQPYLLDGRTEDVVDATIGVSRYPEDASDGEQLYMHADAAVYEAKAEGGRCYRVFTHEISRELNERKQLEESLRHAVRRDEFRLFYQPVVNVKTGEVLGLEALIRWLHPERGLLTPFHFIRLAEETGQIDEIGNWVLQEACRQLAVWDREGVHVPQIAVNVSAHQLETGVLNTDVRRALRDHGIDGARLVLELTESLLMRDVQFAAHTLATLKKHGVRTAVDDFGTGYSSLAYLNRLPLDTLKIDRAFIAPVAAPAGDTRVIEAIIALGRSLKLHIVAEGVEQPAQADFLLRQGCHAMQGYFFSRPMPAEAIPELVGRDWRRQAMPRKVKMG